MRPITFRASASRPCPVCGAGTKGCSATDDDLHICRGEPRAEWRRLTQASDAAGFHHYRTGGEFAPTQRAHPLPSTPTVPAKNWRAEAERFARDLTPDRRQQLADLLGLPVQCLAAFPFVGYSDDPREGPCFTFTEHAPNGAITAINRRVIDPPAGAPNKKVIQGGRRGLYQSRGWRDGPGPVLLPEGASDVLALVAVGLKAVGRPSNTGGVELLAELLADEARDVIVLGENDRKDDGKWPGREGAEATAQKLADALGRPVRWALPPEGVKDVREWVTRLAPESVMPTSGGLPEWETIGAEVLARLEELSQTAPPRPNLLDAPNVKDAQLQPSGEMLVESIDQLTPKAVHYLIPDRIPAGMMGLLAGEGGHGKSVTTLHMVAAVTSGRCAFGLSYPNPVSGRALLISCEDDWEATVVPRLAALGADLTRVLRVRGVRMKADGQLLDFHLGHFRELERLLNAAPDIRLVIIDPAGAFIGRSGVNENKDAELRTILGPLSEAANRTGATILLVKHLNKSAGVSAVQRVSGSSGYINAVRFAYMFAPDPDDTQRKLMVPIKSNVLKSGNSGLAYRVLSMPREDARELLRARWPYLNEQDAEKLSEQLIYQEWDGETEVGADSLFSRPRRDAGHGGSVDECVEFIRNYLGRFAHPEKELHTAVLAGSFSFSAFKKAKAQLRTDDRNDLNRLSGKPRGEGGPWWLWIGPQGQPNPDRPNPDQSASRQVA